MKGLRFKPLGGYPTLHNSSAIVGCRQIDETTEQEIENLFHRSVRFAKDVQRMNIAFQGLKINQFDQ